MTYSMGFRVLIVFAALILVSPVSKSDERGFYHLGFLTTKALDEMCALAESSSDQVQFSANIGCSMYLISFMDAHRIAEKSEFCVPGGTSKKEVWGHLKEKLHGVALLNKKEQQPGAPATVILMLLMQQKYPCKEI